MEFNIRKKSYEDNTWISEYCNKEWGSKILISRGKKHDSGNLEGYVAESGNKPVGLGLFDICDSQIEIVLLASFLERSGIGSALIKQIIKHGKDCNCYRTWLITTNDNTKALSFYQKRGIELVNIYRNAIEYSRKLKPEIPLVGNDGIPIRDEIELENK